MKNFKEIFTESKILNEEKTKEIKRFKHSFGVISVSYTITTYSYSVRVTVNTSFKPINGSEHRFEIEGKEFDLKKQNLTDIEIYIKKIKTKYSK